jgi:hypothetical protein
MRSFMVDQPLPRSGGVPSYMTSHHPTYRTSTKLINTNFRWLRTYSLCMGIAVHVTPII